MFKTVSHSLSFLAVGLRSFPHLDKPSHVILGGGQEPKQVVLPRPSSKKSEARHLCLLSSDFMLLRLNWAFGLSVVQGS